MEWKFWIVLLFAICQLTTADEQIEASDSYLVPKCCNLTEMINNEGKCISLDEPIQFQPYFNDLDENEINLTETEFKIGNPCLYGRYRLEPHKVSIDEYILFSNGTLNVPYQALVLNSNDYCLESFIIDNKIKILPLICFLQNSSENDISLTIQYVIYPSGMLVSMFFLFLTTAFYLYFPTLRNTHGRAVALHSLSLAIAYLSLAIANLGGLDLLEGKLCVIIAYIIQYSFVSSFFWLNVICFDLWRSLRIISNQDTSNKDNKPKLKMNKQMNSLFIYYCIYAYVSPILLTIATSILDSNPILPNFIKPNIGTKSCWFGNDKAALPYFYVPMIISIFFNIFFVISSWKHIINARKKKRLPVPYRSNLYLLVVALSLIIGLPWIMEFISWQVNSNSYVWIFIDLVNVLLGIIIFGVFVLEKRIIHILKNEWNLRVRSNPTTPNTLEQGPPPSSPLIKNETNNN